MFGNTPQSQLDMMLEARKSFSFHLEFRVEDGSLTDVSATDFRMVMQEPGVGGADLYTWNGIHAGLGRVRFDIQASELAYDPGAYPYDITAISAGYSEPVVKGNVVIGFNTDDDTTNIYAVNTNDDTLAITIRDGNIVSIKVDHPAFLVGPVGPQGIPGGIYVGADEPDIEAPPDYVPLWIDTDADSTGVRLDDLADVAVPSDAPTGKLLGKQADGTWGPVDAPVTGLTQEQGDARYLSPSEVVAGTNITVDRTTTPGSVILNGPQVVDSPPEVHIGPNPPTGSETIWIDTDENAVFPGSGISQADADVRYERKLLTTAVARYEAGHLQPGGTALTDLSGNDRHAVFGAGAAAPLVLPYTGEPYVYPLANTNDSNFIERSAVSVPLISTLTFDVRLDEPAAAQWLMYENVEANMVRIMVVGRAIRIGMTSPTGANQELVWDNAYIVGERFRLVVKLTAGGAEVLVNGVSLGARTVAVARNAAVSQRLLLMLGNAGHKGAALYSFALDGSHICDPRNVNKTTYATIRNTGTAGGNWTIHRAATDYKTAVVDRPLVLFSEGQSYATAAVPGGGTRIRYRRAYGTHGTIGPVQTVHTTGPVTLTGVNEAWLGEAVFDRVLTDAEVAQASKELLSAVAVSGPSPAALQVPTWAALPATGDYVGQLCITMDSGLWYQWMPSGIWVEAYTPGMLWERGAILMRSRWAVKQLAPTANGQVLVADSTIDDGIKWAAPAAGGGLDQAAADARYVNVTGDTMSGNLTVTGDVAGNYLSAVYGADMGGFIITRVGTPTLATDAANKSYVDAKPTGITQAEADNRYVWLTGDTISGGLTVEGDLVAGTYLIARDVVVSNSIEVPAPTAPDQAANKGYVDARGYIIALATGAALPGGLPNGTVVVRY